LLPDTKSTNEDDPWEAVSKLLDENSSQGSTSPDPNFDNLPVESSCNNWNLNSSDNMEVFTSILDDLKQSKKENVAGFIAWVVATIVSISEVFIGLIVYRFRQLKQSKSEDKWNNMKFRMVSFNWGTSHFIPLNTFKPEH